MAYGFIYKTTNLVNGKIYIGQHRCDTDEFDGYLGSGVSLLNAVKRYGRRNFKRETLRVCDTQLQLDAWEMLYIKKFDSTNKKVGYNILPGSANKFGQVNPMMIPRVKEKMIKNRRGKCAGECCYWYGKHLSEETKRKISEKAKQRLADPKNNPRYGKHWSEEFKAHMSKKMTGNTNARGKVVSEITRQRIRESGTGIRWITNGVETKRLLRGVSMPDGWWIGRTTLKKAN